MAKSPRVQAFPVFRTRLQSEVLRTVLLAPEEMSITEVATRIQLPLNSVSREVDLLVESSILRSRKVGRTNMVEANRDAPFYANLLGLVVITLGPAQVLSEALRSVPGIVEAHVFGSWAARISGEPGPTPNDIDLLVVGDPDAAALSDALDGAEKLLHRPVNPLRYSQSAWEDRDEAFLESLRTRPMVRVEHDPSAVVVIPPAPEDLASLNEEELLLRSIFGLG